MRNLNYLIPNVCSGRDKTLRRRDAIPEREAPQQREAVPLPWGLALGHRSNHPDFR
ncbi:MAG: hypothetical protein NC095_11980 [Muribaculum sp.]|nr:hypothetical protein [Muribaculum sp.]